MLLPELRLLCWTNDDTETNCPLCRRGHWIPPCPCNDNSFSQLDVNYCCCPHVFECCVRGCVCVCVCRSLCWARSTTVCSHGWSHPSAAERHRRREEETKLDRDPDKQVCSVSESPWPYYWSASRVHMVVWFWQHHLLWLRGTADTHYFDYKSTEEQT